MVATNANTPKTKKAPGILKQLADLRARGDALEAKAGEQAAQPEYGGRLGAMLASKQAPAATTGALGETYYSFAKAAGAFKGFIPQEKAKEEYQIGARLRELYSTLGHAFEAGSLAIPWATNWIPTPSTAAEKLVTEIRQKMALPGSTYDPDELKYQAKRAGIQGKALGTLIDTAGGSFVGGPALGEIIDMQRNMEAFASAGATEIGMAPNGRMMFPKLSSGATGYWVGEASAGTNSQLTSGNLLLESKKLAVLTPINNELFRFSSIGAEAVIRQDMARVAALKADLAMLTGTGGTQIKGLLTYPTQTTWAQGTDKLISMRASTTDDSVGDTFQPQDFHRMESALPDSIELSSWVMRKNMWGILTNRRADAVSAADGKGLFVVQQGIEDMTGRRVRTINGAPVVTTAQVANDRPSYDATPRSLSYVLGGYFPDWVIARFGIAEITPNGMADSVFGSDQTLLRLLQILDAGPRHAASFVLCDYIRQL